MDKALSDVTAREALWAYALYSTAALVIVAVALIVLIWWDRRRK